MQSLSDLLRNLFKDRLAPAGPVEDATAPGRVRGRIAFDPDSCALCRVCARVCPAGAIRFEKYADGLEFTLWHNHCLFCGLCVDYCESEGLQATDDWHLAHLSSERQGLVERAMVDFQKCGICGKQKMPAPLSLMSELYPALDAMEIERLRTLCPQCRMTEMPAAAAGDLS